MTQLRISEAAKLLGVSDDTVRRWVDSGRIAAGEDAAGRAVVEGRDLARIMSDPGAAQSAPAMLGEAPVVAGSARNRFAGLVTAVKKDGVMAQVEVQAGPFRVVSLMSREAADELGLEPGSAVVAKVKATNVTVDIPEASGRGRGA